MAHFRLGLGPRRIERDVDAELAFHLEMRARRLVERGLDPAAARTEALRQFGDWDGVRAELVAMDTQREKTVRRANYLAELRQDTSYAVRSLRHNLGFALAVVLSLAVGIGANTAIFTLIDALLLRPLPVPAADELVVIGDPGRPNGVSEGSLRTDLFSYPVYQELSRRPPLLRGLAATGPARRLDLTDNAPPDSATLGRAVLGSSAGSGGADEGDHPRGRLVSGNYFAVLGVPTLIGRPLTVDDGRVANGSPVVVLSHAYWQRRFAGDPGVLGRTVTINRVPFTVVGVTPPGFTGEVVGRMTDLWMPITMAPALLKRDWLTKPEISWLLMVGRQAPGTKLAQVQATYQTLVRRTLVASNPADDGAAERLAKEVIPVASGARGLSPIRTLYAEPLATLMVAVGLVLLVVCANVANLLLARGAARAREVGVRMALGAGRVRLVRQLLTESLILGSLGGSVGLLLALWGSRALLTLAGGGAGAIPLDARLDWRVLGFTLAITGITAVLFGLLPAIRTTRVEPGTSLRAGGRGATGSRLGRPGGLGLGKVLVVLQVALSLTLLVGTGMLVRSTRALVSMDPGLARDRLLIVTVDAAPTGLEDERLVQLIQTQLERLRTIPGVAAASFSENGIFSGTESATGVEVEGFTARTADDSTVNYDRVGPGYVEAIGARLVAGRDFTDRDDARAPGVALVNTTMAAHYFPRGDAVGHRITADSATYEIVGVVADTKDHEVRQTPASRMYLPAYQTGPMPLQLSFELRAAGDPVRLVAAARRELAAVNGSMVVLNNDPLSTLMRLSISQDLLVARVASVFGLLALGLAALGLYGVMTYTTLRRTSEFGVRMALGADGARVRRMVLREAMTLVAGGALVGVPLALTATRLLRSQLFGVEAVDPPSIALALGVLVLSAAIAGYLPAARAARVGPIEALRAE
jgi:predicted permease